MRMAVTVCDCVFSLLRNGHVFVETSNCKVIAPFSGMYLKCINLSWFAITKWWKCHISKLLLTSSSEAPDKNPGWFNLSLLTRNSGFVPQSSAPLYGQKLCELLLVFPVISVVSCIACCCRWNMQGASNNCSALHRVAGSCHAACCNGEAVKQLPKTAAKCFNLCHVISPRQVNAGKHPGFGEKL